MRWLRGNRNGFASPDVSSFACLSRLHLDGLQAEETRQPEFLGSPHSQGAFDIVFESVEDVELSIDMDGFGGIGIKLRHYDWFALTAPSERPAFKIFFDQDTPVMTPEQVQAIDRRPDLIMYQ